MATSSLPILVHVLTDRRRALAIWAGSLAAVCGMYTGLYPSMAGMDLEAMMGAMPPALIEALGYDELGTAAGYVGTATYGLVALALLLVFAIGNGAKLLAGHEESGALELELTSPLPRASIYSQRLMALWVQLTALVGVVFAVTLGLDLALALGISLVDLSVATLQLWLLSGLLGSVAFAGGAVSGRRSLGLGVAAGLAVVSWMFNAIGPTVELDWMAKISPVGWYMDGNPITRGFHLDDTLLLVLSSAVVIAVGWRSFRKRDLMT